MLGEIVKKQLNITCQWFNIENESSKRYYRIQGEYDGTILIKL